MHVQVVDRLLRVGTAVDDAPISRLLDSLAGRHPGSRQAKLTQEIAIVLSSVGKPGKVAARNDEYVDRRLRVDVAECQHIRILVDDIRREFAERDLAEEAVSHTTV